MDERLKMGLRLCWKAAGTLLGHLGWSKLGLVVFGDGSILSSKSALIPPETMLLALALRARELGMNAILMLNARREHELNLAREEGLAFLRAVAGAPEPLYFGALTEGPLSSLDRVKLSLDWLSANPGTLAKLVEDATPLKRKIKEVDVSSLEALSDFLMDKLGPPSFKEDLTTRVKGADKYQAAADALSTLAAFVTPTSLISVGLRYAAKFFSLVRQRRKEEYRVFLNVWKKNVQEAYSTEALSAIVCEGDGLGALRDSVEHYGLGVVVHDVIGTLHELFLPMLISYVAIELGGQGSLLIVDGASYLAKLGWAASMLVSLQDEAPGTRLACYLPTGNIPEYEALPSMFYALTSERAGIFDMAPKFVDILCENRSAAFRAALLRSLEVAAKERLSGHLAFAIYDVREAPFLKLVKVKPGLLARIKGKLKRFSQGGT